MNQEDTEYEFEHDIQYFNIEVDPGNQPFIASEYTETRSAPILKNPIEYEVAVSRFNIPSLYIPIMEFQQPSPLFLTIAYNNSLFPEGYDFTTGLTQLQYVQRTNKPSPTFFQPYIPFIWNYQEIIDIINNALQTSFTAIKTAYPSAPPTEAPYITYDANSQLLTLIAQEAYQDERQTGTPTFKICFEELLYQYFPSWRIFQWKADQPIPRINIEYNEIMITNNKNNLIQIGGNNYFEMKQEYKTLSLLNSYRAISVGTSMPIVSEFIGTQQNNFRTILTDFLTPVSIDDRETIQYTPQGELRYYDFNTTDELRTVDIKVFWIDNRGKSYPMFIPFNKSLTMKLQFRRKNHYTKKRNIHPVEYNIPKAVDADFKTKLLEDARKKDKQNQEVE